MLRLIGLFAVPGLGLVLRPVVVAVVAAAFLAGMHVERLGQQSRCAKAGGTWVSPGLCGNQP